MHNLSKSQFTKYLKCPKSLWLYKHAPELRSEIDATQQAIMDQGTYVGELAQELFPGGEVIEFDYRNFGGMIERSRELINSGAQTIYEATFSENSVLVMVDILHLGDDSWELYEVKSSTGVRPYHLDDAAIQWHVLKHAGLKLSKAAIVVLNNQYRRKGGLDLGALFKIEDVTHDVLERQTEIPYILEEIQASLSSSKPDILIGTRCKENYDCEFIDHCWDGVPSPSPLDLYRMNGEKRFELYHSGVVHLEDIPYDYKLTATQKLQVDTHKSGEPYISKRALEQFLVTIEYPVSYLDFETFSDAVPRFDGQKVYQQIPFQYSLHIIDEDGAEPLHREFLAPEGEDPRRLFAEALLRDLPATGSIVVYNQSFEKRIIREVAKLFDDLSDDLLALNSRVVDLLIPFQSGAYYHPKFNGSFSIKSVLPALFPDDNDLDYKALEIQNGSDASNQYARLHEVGDKAERELVRSGLLRYCELDTLAMVRIHERLVGLTNQK